MLIYACNTAEGSEGAQFVNTLAALTGADVAASDDRTGAGGDWELEISSGALQTGNFLNGAALTQYAQDLILRTVTSNADSGAGTLRQTIIDAGAGDTITFNAGMSIKLTSGQLVIDKNLTIDGDLDNNGTADVTVNGNAASRVLSITTGTVVLDGLAITNGKLAGTNGIGGPALGAGISVTGGTTQVTILHSGISGNVATGGMGAYGLYSGGSGGNAAGGLYIGSGATVQMAVSTLTSNTGTGGQGGDGYDRGGNGGNGTGGVSVAGGGTFRYQSGTVTISGNTGFGGIGGGATPFPYGVPGVPGSSGTSSPNISGDYDGTWVYDAPPSITSAAIPANTTYVAGQNLDFTVTYNEAVTVNTTGGTPSIALMLDTGGPVQAAYVGGSGSDTLTFRYTVAAGDLDTNGITAATSISLNGGTIQDSGSNNAPTTGIPFASTTGVLVGDAVAPSVSSINRVTGATTNATNATSVQYTVTFTEAVTGVDASDFVLMNTVFTPMAGTVAAVSGSGTTYTVTVNGITGDGRLRLDLKNSGTGITDGAGNAITGGYTSGQTYTIDNTAPAAPSAPDVTSASDWGSDSFDDITSITTLTFTGTAEAGSRVRLYDSDGVTELGSAIATGGFWSITSTPLVAGTHTLTAKATDTAGNVSAASAGLPVTIDTTPPRLVITSNVSTLRIGETADITFAFSENPGATFTSDDVTVSNGTLGALSGTGLHRTATFTPAAATNSGTASITVAAGAYTDTAGNVGYPGATPVLTFDTLAPTLAITSNVSTLKAGETATITFTFSEDPGSTFTWDGTAGDVVVSGGTLCAISGSGTTRTATFTPDTNTNSGTASITVTAASYTDMAGNAGGAGTTPALSFDTLGPSTTAGGFAFSADNGASASDLVTNQAAQTISGTLSAALVAGESVEVSLDNGSTWAAAAATVGSSTWSLAGQTLAGSGTLQARVKGAEGNTGASTSGAYVLDITAPTFNPTTGSAPADDASAVPVSGSFVLSFSEAIASLDITKVYLKDVSTDTLVAATISINGSGELVIQPTTALQNSTAYYVTWDANALKDLAGNAVVAVANETTYNFTTEAAPPPPPPPPGDSDGVSDAEEDSIPGIPRSDGGTVIAGDGNGDGIKDSTQAEVTSLNFRQTGSVSSNPGAPKTPVTLVADSKDGQVDPDTGTAQITSISQKDAPANLPEGFSAPLGLLSFTAKIDTAGGTENFSFYVDSSLDINGYYKQDASGTWINLASPENGGKVVVENGKTRLDFAIQDGGKFDADGKADGIITDPGAPGKWVQVTPECPYDPFRNDADKDQVPDAIELAAGTNVNVKDNNVFGNNSQWVNQLWRDLYGREGYGDSQATQLAQSLSQGSVSKTQALAQVLSSQELDNHAGAVLRLFHTVLDRSPKMCGYNYWLGQANEGTSVLEMGRAFLNSPEFVQQYAGLDNSAFVDFLYKNALHRMPHAAGKAGWLQQLESGAMDRAEVLYGVAQSAEAKAVMSGKVAVDLLFLGLLNREPKAAGAAYWEGQYPAIGDLAQFMKLATGASAEYHDRFVPSDGLAVSIVGSAPGVSSDVLG